MLLLIIDIGVMLLLAAAMLSAARLYFAIRRLQNMWDKSLRGAGARANPTGRPQRD